MLAAGEGHLEIVKCLIEAGADINARRNDGRTAVMLAANEGHLETVKWLTDAGADTQGEGYGDGASYNDNDTTLLQLMNINDGESQDVRLPGVVFIEIEL